MNCNTKIEGHLGALRLLASTFLRRAGSCCAPANIAPSHHVAARLDLPRTAVIFHGVPDPFADAKGKKETPALENSNFAYVGRLVAEKGVSVLLEAVRLLRAEGRAVKVLIIGDGPERVRLEKRIAASHLEPCIRITGFLSGEALEHELRKVSTIVIPTIMEETAGLAALGGASGAPYERVSDASVAYDKRHNTWLVSSIPLTPSTSVPVIFVSRSTNSGASWTNPVSHLP